MSGNGISVTKEAVDGVGVIQVDLNGSGVDRAVAKRYLAKQNLPKIVEIRLPRGRHGAEGNKLFLYPAKGTRKAEVDKIIDTVQTDMEKLRDEQRLTKVNQTKAPGEDKSTKEVDDAPDVTRIGIAELRAMAPNFDESDGDDILGAQVRQLAMVMFGNSASATPTKTTDRLMTAAIKELVRAASVMPRIERVKVTRKGDMTFVFSSNAG